MVTKTILLKENECALDAIASLGEDTKRSWIFIDAMCYQDMIKTCDCIDSFVTNIFRIIWQKTVKYPETVLVMQKDEMNKWYDIREIYARDIAFRKKTLTPEIIFFIVKDSENKLKDAERLYVPEDMCPIDFIINMGEEAKGKTFIFPKYLVSKMAMGRMSKKITRNGSKFNITWPDNWDFMRFEEIDETHNYILEQMDVEEFVYKKTAGKVVKLV